MSESIPLYIPCATGNNAFADFAIARHGDLIRFLGHAQMDLTADDAKRLADHILDLLDNPYQEARKLDRPPEEAASSGDAIVDETIAMLLARSKLGQEKYGTTLMRDDVSLLDWMRYAIEESLDRTLYMVRALKDLENLYNDGR